MTTSNVTSASNPYQTLINAVNGSSTSSSTSSTSTASSNIQNEFLTLLTTQLKNQDPLNPMDNNQMTSQLAQISTVTGIEQLNATLQTLLQSSQNAQTTQAAALVGQAVMVPGNGLQLSSSSAVGAIELPSAADTVKVTISDSNGIAVRSMSLGALGAGLHDFTWDGKTDSGSQVADGSYTIAVTASSGSNSVTATALTLGSVRSVISGTSGYSLDLGSLGTFSMNDVKQIL